MAITSIDDNIARAGGSYIRTDPFWIDYTATTSTVLAGSTAVAGIFGMLRPMPGSLPTGVTKFIPNSVTFAVGLGSTQGLIIGRLVRLGQLDISGPTFTADATTSGAMPTITELNVSRQVHSALFIRVKTALNATPGSITVTYVDQDGNASETTSAAALTASCAVGTTALVTLNTGDTGVRSISTATRTGGTTPTGVVEFYGFIPWKILPGLGSALATELTYGPGFANISLGAGESLGIINWGLTTARTICGYITYIGDS